MRCCCCLTIVVLVVLELYCRLLHEESTHCQTKFPLFTHECAILAGPVVFLFRLAFLCALCLGRLGDRTPRSGGGARSHIQSKKFGKVCPAEDLCYRALLGQRKRDVGVGDQLFFVDSMEPEKEFRLSV